jgi:hypothetical protein
LLLLYWLKAISWSFDLEELGGFHLALSNHDFSKVRDLEELGGFHLALSNHDFSKVRKYPDVVNLMSASEHARTSG